MKKVVFLTIMLFACCLSAGAATADDIIAAAKKALAPDKRTAIWDLSATKNAAGTLLVSGTLGTNQQKTDLQTYMRQQGIACDASKVKILQNDIPGGQQNAMVKISVATLRITPAHAGEVATQAVMGTPLRVIEKAKGWLRVQMPDNYIAYVPESSVIYRTDEQMSAWRAAKRVIVTTYCSQLLDDAENQQTVSDLVLGNILQYQSQVPGYVIVSTPDGRVGYISTQDVEDFKQWSEQPFNLDVVEKNMRRMLGSPYLWGGTSTKATDCSGLMKVGYFSNAIILARDASQQTLYGKKIDVTSYKAQIANLQRGDLLFFDSGTPGRVSHVGMYLGNGKFIHCSGQVKINSLDPNDPTYLYSPCAASRINGMLNTPYITPVKNHNWYF